MAHCPPQLLDDLAALLAEVRTWPGVVEKKPGVFYVRGRPFLHFHLVEGGRRRADIKGRDGRQPIDLPPPIGAARRRAFLRVLRARHGEAGPRPPSCIVTAGHRRGHRPEERA